MKMHLTAFILSTLFSYMAYADHSSQQAGSLTRAKTWQRVQADQSASTGLDLTTAATIVRQEAVIDKKLSDYADPKKGFVSPHTVKFRLAEYGEAIRKKLVQVGNQNFPKDEKESLYGSVLISIEITPDGSIAHTEILRPDPNPKINEAALHIIRLAAPYAPFPPDIRNEFDSVILSRTLNFTREDINIGSQ